MSQTRAGKYFMVLVMCEDARRYFVVLLDWIWPSGWAVMTFKIRGLGMVKSGKKEVGLNPNSLKMPRGVASLLSEGTSFPFQRLLK